ATERETNLAQHADGGVLVDAPAEYNNDTWAARNLLALPGQGEFAAPTKEPIAVVIGFPQGRLARIRAVGVHPFATEDKTTWVRRVEVETSDTHPFTGFRTAGTFDVPPEPTEAMLTLKE